jgi:proteasome lid subunit RPN8/RPN11
MIEIKKIAYDEMVAHAKSGVPNEVCGYLAGTEGVLTKVYRMTNVSTTPEVFFNFDPKEMFKVQKESRTEGLRLLNVYHSHPKGGNKPSVSDKEFLKDPSLNYIIISLEHADPEVNGFWIKNGEAGPLEIKIID